MTGMSNSNGYYALFAEARHALKCGQIQSFGISHCSAQNVSRKS